MPDDDSGPTASWTCPRRRSRICLACCGRADSAELKLTIPQSRPRVDAEGARTRPARRPDPAGVLLRHPRPPAGRRRRGRPGPPGSGQGRRHRRQASAGRSRRAAGRAARAVRTSASRSTRCRRASTSAARRSRGRRRRCARRSSPAARTASCSPSSSAAFFAEHAPAGIELDDLVGARPDLRTQGQVRPGRARPSTGGGVLALPRR